ncbi:MAG: serine--tRNA ligase, partial [Planctomycetes bacterium]|nr:serine--tRNA ligase [Planctomycetota bacterium]
MIDIKLIRKDPQRFIKGAADKNFNVDIQRLLAIDGELRTHKNQLQKIATQKNKIGKSIPNL